MIRLFDVNNAVVPGSWMLSSDARGATFYPARDLASEARYKLLIGTTIRDLAGNSLGAPVSAEFTTAASSGGNRPAAPVLDPQASTRTASSFKGVLKAAEYFPDDDRNRLPKEAVVTESSQGIKWLPADDPQETVKALERVVAIVTGQRDKAQELYKAASEEALKANEAIKAKDEAIKAKDAVTRTAIGAR